MTEPVVSFDRVSKRYGAGPLILEEISFSATAGEFISLIGPSGCGKSTLLRLIAGLSPVSNGRLHLGQKAEDIGFVFQEPTLLPWLTVERNVDLPLKLSGLPAAQRRARTNQALQQVRLPEKAAAYPRQLSGGQKMRVSIARALARQPAILLLDEPFGALDEMTRDHLNEELLSLREQQAWTAFFVTHSVAEAVFLSSRVLVLSANPGKIHAEFSVPWPYPRTAATRQSDDFHHRVVEISRSLHAVDPSAPAAS